jgi:hypothetical protein
MGAQYFKYLTALLICMTLGCTTTTLGNKLGVEVMGAGTSIEINWDPLHAWDQQLASKGAQLIAEYSTEGKGLVRETIATGLSNGNRSLAFSLPNSLKAPPLGELCLYVQVAGSGALLPIRKSAGGMDTARFRYAAWDSAVIAETKSRQLSRYTEFLRTEVARLNTLGTQRLVDLTERGWPTQGSCKVEPSGQQKSVKPPLGFFEQNQRDAIARQVCIHRVSYGRRLFEAKLGSTSIENRLNIFDLFGGLAVAVPETAEIILSLPPSSGGIESRNFDARREQAKKIREDWQKYSSLVGPDYWPPFGGQKDYLRVVSESKSANVHLLRQVYGQKAGLPVDQATPAPKDQFGALGAVVDSYLGCVDDGKKQLDTIANSWIALQSNSPQRQKQIAEYFAQECRREHQSLVDLQADQLKMNRELEELKSTSTDFNIGRSKISSQRLSLNNAMCRS